MASEARIGWTTGRTLYGIVFRKSDDKVWYPTGAAFETWGTSGHTIDDYSAISFTETASGSCRYVGDFPTAITTAGTYDVVARQRAGATPATTDLVAGMIAIDWRGTAAAVTEEDTGLGALITEIQLLTGRVGDTEIVTSDQCVRWLNRAQLDIANACNAHINLVHKHDTAITLVADTYSYSIASLSPSLLHFLKAFYIDGTNSKKLSYVRTEDFDLAYPNPLSQSTGIPDEVTRRGMSLEVYPVPTSSEAGKYLRADYAKRPTAFTTSDLTALTDLTDAEEGLVFYATSKAFKAVAGEVLAESDRYWQYYLAWLEGYRQEWDGNLMSGVDELFM